MAGGRRGQHGRGKGHDTMFSLAPPLLIVISPAGPVFGDTAARGEIQTQFDALVGPLSASAVQGPLAGVHHPTKGVVATLLGVLLLLAGAASVFGRQQDTLDRIWRVPSRAPRNGWLTLLRWRLLSCGMILVPGFVLTVSLVASATLAALRHTLNPLLGNGVTRVGLGNAIGALFTAALFVLGMWLTSLCIGRSGVASGFGAEFTRVSANLFGARKRAQFAP